MPYPTREYSEIIKFFSQGGVAGTLYGLFLYLALDGPARAILAGLFAGAWFGFTLGVIAAVFLRSILSALCIGSLLGGFAGLIWWVVVGATSAFSTSMIQGAVICSVYALFVLRPWRSPK